MLLEFVFFTVVLYDFGEIYKYRLLKHVKIHQSVKHCIVRWSTGKRI